MMGLVYGCKEASAKLVFETKPKLTLLARLMNGGDGMKTVTLQVATRDEVKRIYID